MDRIGSCERTLSHRLYMALHFACISCLHELPVILPIGSTVRMIIDVPDSPSCIDMKSYEKTKTVKVDNRIVQ